MGKYETKAPLKKKARELKNKIIIYTDKRGLPFAYYRHDDLPGQPIRTDWYFSRSRASKFTKTDAAAHLKKLKKLYDRVKIVDFDFGSKL